MQWLDKLYNRRLLRRHNAQFEEFPTIYGRLMIALFAEYGRFKFGRGVVINSCLAANPVGGFRTIFLIKGPNAMIEVDDQAGISNALICAKEYVYIGKEVNLGAGCKIFDTDFHSADFDERQADTNIPAEPVYIRDGAFIGADACVLKGVTIGEKAVIGARAVVTKDVAPGEIWAGNPAKCIKKPE